MALYNLKSADGSWRITKFTNDLDVESSYLLSESECACPAGSRPTCRHRQMLPKMLAVGAEDSGLFYDFDSDKFFEPLIDSDVPGTAFADVTSIIAEPTCVDEVASAASGSSSEPEPESESATELHKAIEADLTCIEIERVIGAHAVRSAELVEQPATIDYNSITYLSQNETTIVEYMRQANEIHEDVIKLCEVHPTIGHIKRRV